MQRSSKRSVIFAFCILFAILCVAGVLIYLFFKFQLPGLWSVFSSGDKEALTAYLDNRDLLSGILISWFLNFVQVISIVIPAMPVQLAAGLSCGTGVGFLVSYSASVVANLLVFLYAKRFSVALSMLAENHPKLGKFLNYLKSSPNAAYYTMLAFLTPGLPNGIVPYAAANAAVPPKSFVLALLAALPVPTLLTCYAGSLMAQGNVIFAAAMLVALYALVAFLFSKRKTFASKMA